VPSRRARKRWIEHPRPSRSHVRAGRRRLPRRACFFVPRVRGFGSRDRSCQLARTCSTATGGRLEDRPPPTRTSPQEKNIEDNAGNAFEPTADRARRPETSSPPVAAPVKSAGGPRPSARAEAPPPLDSEWKVPNAFGPDDGECVLTARGTGCSFLSARQTIGRKRGAGLSFLIRARTSSARLRSVASGKSW